MNNLDQMLYINRASMEELGVFSGELLGKYWDLLAQGLIDFGEEKAILPLDAYLRTKEEDQFDRIIAKAGVINETAGLKWISSAPLNTKKGIPRANGILILNDIVTGLPYAILDAVPISNIRTAGVSMLFLREFSPNFERAVIFGTGIHGREHLGQLLYGMEAGIFPKLKEIFLYDLFQESAEKMKAEYDFPLGVLTNVEDCFEDNTAVIFCTNALTPYVRPSHFEGCRNLAAVHMSLRDFLPECLPIFDYCVADSAPHVARAKTSVDLAVSGGMMKLEDCLELPALLIQKRDSTFSPFPEGSNVIFNPMGLASHDLVIGRYVYELAKAKGIGAALSV
ncbi:MAG: hypothetical protein AAF502_07075 [Bacteroidota bacterium]